ncbi:MAG TPA: hypothetical protein VNU72_05490 [Puia sp.]|jgi:hypothetical protein|nr:hypothetical protein [Puia sp.]
MRTILALSLGFTSLTLLFSCGSSKKMSNYTPFTRDLKQKLDVDNIDLKEIQFYVDQKIVLNRNLGSQDITVKNGVVKQSNGKYINEVVIPSLTPGICTGTDFDRLLVSFEKGNSYLAFGPGSANNANNYVLYGTEWKLGTALVSYDAEKFRARCGTCSDVAAVTLVIKKKELDKLKRKTRKATGRTVSK